MKHTFYLLLCSLFLLTFSQEPKAKNTKTEHGIVCQIQSDSIVISVISDNNCKADSNLPENNKLWYNTPASVHYVNLKASGGQAIHIVFKSK